VLAMSFIFVPFLLNLISKLLIISNLRE